MSESWRATLMLNEHGNVVADRGSGVRSVVEVMTVAEHERLLAEERAWSNSSEHPNWEAGWHAGRSRACHVSDEMIDRATAAIEESFRFLGHPETRRPGTEAVDCREVARVALEAALDA